MPRIQPDDTSVVQMFSDSSVLVQSGGVSFVCQTAAEEQAVVFDECRPLLSRFAYSQLQFGAMARAEDKRLRGVPQDEVDLATEGALREAGCTIEIGSFDFFTEDSLAKLGMGYGLNPDLVPFARATVEEIARASFDRLFSAGAVSFLDSRTKVSLKDCA
ncbi:MAG: hypothetical protein NTW20_01455 [Rhodobacterales bacterium]|nr:hypothetical protein [Rhodobacterales bacterium]